MNKKAIIDFIIYYYEKRNKQLNIKKEKMEEMNTIELLKLLK